jgi:hypothetical protein
MARMRFFNRPESDVQVCLQFPAQQLEELLRVLRDRHADKEYVFEADQSETAATVDAEEVTARATGWATHFYKDLVHIENCEFRHKPPRFWLISFVRSNGEKVYAAVLPDGTIVKPRTLRRS